MNNWIDLNDRLPLHGQTVLIYTKLKSNGAYAVRLSHHWSNGEFRILESNINCVDALEPTHWQPLPEPPNKKEQKSDSDISGISDRPYPENLSEDAYVAGYKERSISCGMEYDEISVAWSAKKHYEWYHNEDDH